MTSPSVRCTCTGTCHPETAPSDAYLGRAKVLADKAQAKQNARAAQRYYAGQRAWDVLDDRYPGAFPAALAHHRVVRGPFMRNGFFYSKSGITPAGRDR